eukprot:3195629-Rhodomonas_salina.1
MGKLKRGPSSGRAASSPSTSQLAASPTAMLEGSTAMSKDLPRALRSIQRGHTHQAAVECSATCTSKCTLSWLEQSRWNCGSASTVACVTPSVCAASLPTRARPHTP